jgi:hypothetical protein
LAKDLFFAFALSIPFLVTSGWFDILTSNGTSLLNLFYFLLDVTVPQANRFAADRFTAALKFLYFIVFLNRYIQLYI